MSKRVKPRNRQRRDQISLRTVFDTRERIAPVNYLMISLLYYVSLLIEDLVQRPLGTLLPRPRNELIIVAAFGGIRTIINTDIVLLKPVGWEEKYQGEKSWRKTSVLMF